MYHSLDKSIWFKIIFLPLGERLTLVAGLGGRRLLFPFHHMFKIFFMVALGSYVTF